MSKRFLMFITLVWILVIWTHSAMPGNVSSNESGFVVDLLEKLGWFDDVENIEHYVRKLAHFLEYTILGSLVMLNVYINFKPQPTIFLVALLVGIGVPFVDETIQLFTEGRNGAIVDVWIDFAGFLTGSAVSVCLYKLYQSKSFKRTI